MEIGTYIEACKIKSVRLVESSSRLINPDAKPGKMEIFLKHEVNFSVPEEKIEEDFFLDFYSELRAVDLEKNDIFEIKAGYKVSYVVFDTDKTPPAGFAVVSELLGHQIFPVIRTFFAETLMKMGLPPFVPWSMQESPEKSNEKKAPKKTTRKTVKKSGAKHLPNKED